MKRYCLNVVMIIFLGEIVLLKRLDIEISEYIQERYTLSYNHNKITRSLEADNKKVIFQPAEVEELFKEAGVLFPGQIKQDFEMLIDFDQSITAERFFYLSEELVEIKNKSKSIDERLAALDKQCSNSLAFLSNGLTRIACQIPIN